VNVRRSLAGAVAGLVSAVAVLAGVGTAAEASESHRRISVAGTRHHLALLEGRVRVIAHRGASATAPESTLPAARPAVSAEADVVEFDVQRTADGHLIVVRGTTFARTSHVAQVFPGRENDPVGSFTAYDVRRLDAGPWRGPQDAGTRVPTLHALLTLMLARPAVSQRDDGAQIERLVEPGLRTMPAAADRRHGAERLASRLSLEYAGAVPATQIDTLVHRVVHDLRRERSPRGRLLTTAEAVCRRQLTDLRASHRHAVT